MQKDFKLIKKTNPELIEYPKYNLDVVRIKNKKLDGLSKESLDIMVERLTKMGFKYICFGNTICLAEISKLTKCGIFCGIGMLFPKDKGIVGPWQDTWNQPFKDLMIVTKEAEYNSIINVVWDYKNNKVYKI